MRDDALGRDSHHFDREDRRLLPMIDTLKAQLVRPEQADGQMYPRTWPPAAHTCSKRPR